jgi:hypothetical protein
MSYYKENHEDLRIRETAYKHHYEQLLSEGFTQRIVKHRHEKKSFIESTRSKFKKIKQQTEPLKQGYLVTIEL